MATAAQPEWLNTVLYFGDKQHFGTEEEHEKVWEEITLPWWQENLSWMMSGMEHLF